MRVRANLLSKRRKPATKKTNADFDDNARSKTMYIINNLLPVLVGNMGRHCTRVQYLPMHIAH